MSKPSRSSAVTKSASVVSQSRILAKRKKLNPDALRDDDTIASIADRGKKAIRAAMLQMESEMGCFEGMIDKWARQLEEQCALLGELSKFVDEMAKCDEKREKQLDERSARLDKLDKELTRRERTSAVTLKRPGKPSGHRKSTVTPFR